MQGEELVAITQDLILHEKPPSRELATADPSPNPTLPEGRLDVEECYYKFPAPQAGKML
jgi:hypothetical protein